MGYLPGVDAVVVNYRTPQDLMGFLDSYVPASDFPNDLYVCNVCPEDGDRTAASAAPSRSIQMEFEENVGYARAVNAAAMVGKREVLAIFNADIRLRDHRALEHCHGALLTHAEASNWAILGPRQVNDEGRIVHAGIFGTHEKPVHRGWLATDTVAYSDVRDAVTVSGSAYFILRSVWDELTNCDLYRRAAPDAEGAFLPTAHYYEETWCSYHAYAHGYRVGYFGPVTLTHRWHQASPVGGWAEQQMKVSQEFFRKACEIHAIPCD